MKCESKETTTSKKSEFMLIELTSYACSANSGSSLNLVHYLKLLYLYLFIIFIIVIATLK